MDNILSQIFRSGKISSVNPENCTARVYFEDLDKVSGDLRLLMGKTQNDKDYWLPDIHEMVDCLFLPIGMSEGIILGSSYNEEDTPPWNNADLHGRKYKDGSFWRYNRSSGILDVEIVTQINLKVPQLVIDGEVSISGKLTAGGDIHSDGDVTAGAISLQQHKHIGNQGNPTSEPIGE